MAQFSVRICNFLPSNLKYNKSSVACLCPDAHYQPFLLYFVTKYSVCANTKMVQCVRKGVLIIRDAPMPKTSN